MLLKKSYIPEKCNFLSTVWPSVSFRAASLRAVSIQPLMSLHKNINIPTHYCIWVSDLKTFSYKTIISTQSIMKLFTYVLWCTVAAVRSSTVATTSSFNNSFFVNPFLHCASFTKQSKDKCCKQTHNYIHTS